MTNRPSAQDKELIKPLHANVPTEISTVAKESIATIPTTTIASATVPRGSLGNTSWTKMSLISRKLSKQDMNGQFTSLI